MNDTAIMSEDEIYSHDESVDDEDGDDDRSNWKKSTGDKRHIMCKSTL